jgi:hypothetical protein
MQSQQTITRRRIGVLDVAGKLCVHPMTVPRLVREGRLPLPDKIINKNLWWEDEIDELIRRGLPRSNGSQRERDLKKTRG